MKKIRIILIIIVLALAFELHAQKNAVNWDKWSYLIGEWINYGNGQPEQGKGSFSFTKDLGGQIIIRKNHAEFPASEKQAASSHDDMLIIYADNGGIPGRAIYFDNEGHILNYSITYSDSSIVLIHEQKQSFPGFRLTYSKINSKRVNVKFEISYPQKPDAFKPYLEAICVKVK